MSESLAAPELSSAQKYLGRRLRPWWGQRPSRLVVRGIVGIVIFGVATVAILKFAADSAAVGDLADNLDFPNGRVRLIALIAAGVCGLALLHGLVSLIVGIVDVATRRTIEGTVTSARHRYPGDWLPTPIRWILRFRQRRNRDFHQAQR